MCLKDNTLHNKLRNGFFYYETDREKDHDWLHTTHTRSMQIKNFLYDLFAFVIKIMHL